VQHQQQLRDIQTLIQKGQFDQALDALQLQMEQPLDQDKKAESLYLKAVCLRLRQSNDLALKTLEQLLKLVPEHGRAHQEQGYNYRSLKNDKQASICFYKASQLNPALLSAWQALLPLYQDAQQADAVRLCQIQISKLTALPKALLAATDLMHEGKLVLADQVCRQYLRQHKHALVALQLLAEIALKLKAVSEAEFILETCVELAPENDEVQYQLFKIYCKLGKFEQALALAEKLSDKASDNLLYQAAKATAWVGVGELSKAIGLYEKLVDQQKKNANIQLLLGHACKSEGNIKKSVGAYQAAYAIEPDYGDAYWSLANTKTYVFSQTEIDQMLMGTTSDNISVTNKIHLHFALGKAHEDLADYATSFHHYALGNELQRSKLSYSSDTHQSYVEHQIKYFSPELLSSVRAKDKGCQDPSPIFIVGMPRAGSTLIEQILASHSQVDGTMELHEILGLAARLSKRQEGVALYPQNLLEIPEQVLAELGQQFMQNTQVYRQSAAYFIDKMPNNYMHIGLIKLILPKAKIIDARREPMACCFSGFKQLFGDGQEFSYSLTDIASYYQNYVKLMDHWQGLFPGEILLLQHEDVVKDTEKQVRRLLDFCGLEFEKSCLSFYKNKRAVKTPSAEQVRQPIYTSGLEQWKHFAPYLDDLKFS
jgi:tetratricopeptide (TPR) repeat protein